VSVSSANVRPSSVVLFAFVIEDMVRSIGCICIEVGKEGNRGCVGVEENWMSVDGRV
jgi:hypothetical protein